MNEQPLSSDQKSNVVVSIVESTPRDAPQQQQSIPSSYSNYEQTSNLFTSILLCKDGWQHDVRYSITHYFPRFKLVRSGPMDVDERPPVLQTVTYGLQHALAMFSGTVFILSVQNISSALAFLLNVKVELLTTATLFFAGISTIIFFICTGGRVPSFLGSSGSVVSAVIASTGFDATTMKSNPNIPIAQGGLIFLSLIYIFIAFLVMVFGHQWIEFLMPPIVTGAIITSIGVKLGYSAFSQATSTPFDTYMAIATVLAIMLIQVYAPVASLRRISILLGMIVGYIIHVICGATGAGYQINFSEVVSIPWVRGPLVSGPPIFDPRAISFMAPIVVILLAENMGHLKAISSLLGRPLDGYLGRAYLGDALSSLMAGCVGAAPLTTYAENIGVLSVTRIFSPVVILFAALVAIVLGLISKFGAVVRSIPNGVFGATTLVLYTLIGMTGVRIWVVNGIDFSDPRNIYIGGLPVILAAAMTSVSLQINDFQLDGIGVATFSSIILNQLLRGYDGFKVYYLWIKRQCCRRRKNASKSENSSFHASPS
ncbi:hypothetical protein VTP01DRAFT_9426 [Rhizomucor pusillus]|uniref:uncharacterized protein n=1 Tax=Rhizomucor pusillus TaxID=4840 RepID=UPI0037433F8E